MKLTYTTMIDGVFEQYIFDGTADEVVAAWDVFDFDDPDPPECSLTGRSCFSCWHGRERYSESCKTCGVHYANYEPASQQETHLGGEK